mmetsp:Transcript_22420/g.29461  ORF Transcript_22420/g.29461 Transcript_22420/m.29461 type:complete len:472 (+) Transcript_22420:136-1551(+)
MEPIQQDHEHFKSFRDSNHNFGDTMPVTNFQGDKSSSSMSSSTASSSSSPTTLPRDFSELHVQDQHQPPVSSTGFGGGLEALALACVASARPSKPPTKPKKTITTKPPTHNKTTTATTSPPAVPDRSLALVGKKDQIVLPIESGEAVVSTDEGATTNGNHISQSDVLCGRGGLTNHHAGNMFFRRLVRLKQEAYLLASKREKAGVARDIVDSIRQLQPPGRFLKKDAKNPNTWVEIGDRKAREKTSQALREGAPELREVVKSGTSTKSSSASNKAGNTRKKTTAASCNLTRSAPSQPPLQSSAVTSKQRISTPLSNESSSSSIPLPTSPTMTFNRARIVSDDSVVEWGYRNGVERVQQVPQDAAPSALPQPLATSAFMLPVCEDEDHSSRQRHLPPHQQPTTPYFYEPADLPPQTLYTSSSAAVAHSATAGSKRKSPTNCSVQERHTWESSSCNKNRGPRLKLFKSRLMDY